MTHRTMYQKTICLMLWAGLFTLSPAKSEATEPQFNVAPTNISILAYNEWINLQSPLFLGNEGNCVSDHKSLDWGCIPMVLPSIQRSCDAWVFVLRNTDPRRLRNVRALKALFLQYNDPDVPLGNLTPYWDSFWTGVYMDGTEWEGSETGEGIDYYYTWDDLDTVEDWSYQDFHFYYWDKFATFAIDMYEIAENNDGWVPLGGLAWYSASMVGGFCRMSTQRTIDLWLYVP